MSCCRERSSTAYGVPATTFAAGYHIAYNWLRIISLQPSLRVRRRKGGKFGRETALAE